MCGIAGLWSVFDDTKSLDSTVRAMTAAIHHRGPEAEGYAQGPNWALGHARLAIVDVAGGNQPIWNEDHTAVIVGNNEIYNAPELRAELLELGHRFRTHSDTEVALHAYLEWGEAAFARLNGMYALAIVDTNTRRCLLVRDPMGIKPLHFTRVRKGIAFGSEIKALLAIDALERKPDWDAVHLFMNFRYVPDERTLFHGVERLPPGAFAVLTENSCHIQRYFSLANLPQDHVSLSQAAPQLSELLPKAIKRHLISDVEVASYLSGGIDSSIISVHAAKSLPHLKTFCMSFGEPTDENSDARKVANLIHSEHTDLDIGAQPLDRFEEILWHVEEPKVNCMQGYFLAERVREHVKVVLSGLGGDELFAGYVNNDILFPMSIFSRFRRGQNSLTLSALQKLAPVFSSDLYFRAGELGLNLTNPLAFYTILRNGFDHNPTLLKQIYVDPPRRWQNLAMESLRPFYDERNPDVLNEILKLEARTKLPNDFLLTEDRVSMASSLEVRVPFLDLELVKFAFSLPSSLKYRPGNKKRLLKIVGRDWLPESILEKRKWGFSVNPYLLYQKQLRTFATQVLTESAVKEMGLFNWKWICDVLDKPANPKMRWHYFNLWVMAGMTLWHRTFFGGTSKR
jgi:asparagine synthase (glutamine-hydrolysing)